MGTSDFHSLSLFLPLIVVRSINVLEREEVRVDIYWFLCVCS